MKSEIFHGLLVIFFMAFNVLSAIVWAVELFFHYSKMEINGFAGIPLLNPIFN
jgi:hypothetical protein